VRLPLVPCLARDARARRAVWRGCGGSVSRVAPWTVVDFGPESIAFPIWGESDPIGHFSVVSEGMDVTSPKTLRLRTDAGDQLLGITAEIARTLFPPRWAFSGYAIRNDAPFNADCPTGTQIDCWRPGDPPLRTDDVVAALCASFDFPLDVCPFWEQ